MSQVAYRVQHYVQLTELLTDHIYHPKHRTIHQRSSRQHFYTSSTTFCRTFPYSTQTYLIPIMLPSTLNQCSYNESQQDALFLNFILVKNFTCFGQIYCPSSRVLILYSQQLVLVILVMLTAC